MKKSLMVLALAGAMSAQAVDWNLKTGGNLDEESNWSSPPAQGDTLYVKKTLTGPLTLSGTEVNLFGGAMLRYNGNITVTNDFGAGNAVTNIGAGAGSALHVENGATLVHKSGKIVAYKGSSYDGTYLTGKAKLVLDGPDAIFEQAGGSFILRSNGSTGIDREYLIVTNGATLAISNGLHIGENGKASEGHVIVTGAGTKAVVRGTTSVGFDVGNDGVTNILEVLDGGALCDEKTRHRHKGVQWLSRARVGRRHDIRVDGFGLWPTCDDARHS